MPEAHAERVKLMMAAFRQKRPEKPTVPDDHRRVRQGRLCIGELFELVEALGLEILVDGQPIPLKVDNEPRVEVRVKPGVTPDQLDLAHILKELADCSVVNRGTILTCGVQDVDPLLAIVDVNNITRAANGYHDEFGKFHKTGNPPKAEVAIKMLIDVLTGVLEGNR